MDCIELTLPEFAFVEGYKPDDELHGRIVILHVRSASVIEIFERDDVILNNEVFTHKFKYTNKLGVGEKMIAALHYCATLDIIKDQKLIKDEILKPAAMWYCDYCNWEDNNIIEGTKS